jgi:hypothetical protein
MNKILLRSQVSLSRLNRRVPQQHLDLLKLAASRATQLRAGATSVMGRPARISDGRLLCAAAMPEVGSSGKSRGDWVNVPV